MAPKKSKRYAVVTPTMHYAVVLALIISLITSFALGLLLTDALFGGGLDYFHRAAREGLMIGKVRAMQAALAGKLETVSVHIDGHTLPLTDPGNIINDSVVSGDWDDPSSGTPMTASFVYKEGESFDASSNPNYGEYRIERPLNIHVGDYDFTVKGYTISVYNDVPACGYFSCQFYPVIPYYDEIYVRVNPFIEGELGIEGMAFVLHDSTASILSSDALPTGEQLLGFPGRKTLAIWGYLATQYDQDPSNDPVNYWETYWHIYSQADNLTVR